MSSISISWTVLNRTTCILVSKTSIPYNFLSPQAQNWALQINSLFNMESLFLSSIDVIPFVFVFNSILSTHSFENFDFSTTIQYSSLNNQFIDCCQLRLIALLELLTKCQQNVSTFWVCSWFLKNVLWHDNQDWRVHVCGRGESFGIFDFLILWDERSTLHGKKRKKDAWKYIFCPKVWRFSGIFWNVDKMSFFLWLVFRLITTCLDSMLQVNLLGFLIWPDWWFQICLLWWGFSTQFIRILRISTWSIIRDERQLEHHQNKHKECWLVVLSLKQK